MTAFDLKIFIGVFLCFVFGLLGMATAYLVIDSRHSAYETLKDFSGPLTALISVAGAIFAAGMAFAGVKQKMEFDRKLLKRNSISQGQVMMRETYHRLSDLRWFVAEIRGAFDRYQDRLPEEIADEVFDGPRRASLQRLQEFAHNGWSRLEKVHLTQRRELSFYVSGIETGCENLYGIVDRADAFGKRHKENPTPAEIATLRGAYNKMVTRCLADLEEAANNLCSDYTAENPGYDFDHVNAANYS